MKAHPKVRMPLVHRRWELETARSDATEVGNEEEAARNARRTEREPEEEPESAINRYETSIGLWRARIDLRIYQGLDDYGTIGELDGQTVINVVEVKFDMLGNPMGRILDPTPGWVALSLGMGEPYCDFLALPLDDGMD